MKRPQQRTLNCLKWWRRKKKFSELEKEVRAFFQELIDAGVEPSEFMDDPRWEDLNERCVAEGLSQVPILLQMTAMG